MFWLLNYTLLLFFGFNRFLFLHYRCRRFVNCHIPLFLCLALLEILSEICEYPLYFSVMYLKHFECQVLKRHTIEYIRLILGILAAIGLTEEHFQLELLFSLFNSFLCEKFGVLNKSVQFGNLSYETISGTLKSLLDQLLWGFQLGHISFNEPIDLIFCKVGIAHRISWKGKVLFLHSLTLHLSQVHFSKHLSFILCLLIHNGSNM